MTSLPSQRFLRLGVFFPLLSLILLFGIGPAKPSQGGKDSQPLIHSQWKTYHDPRVPFEFRYPGNFLLDAHVNPKLGFVFALMKKIDSPKYHWLIDIDYQDRADFNDPPFAKMSFEQFAILRARTGCDADGPEGSVSCPALVRSKPFTNPAGLEGVEIYLKQVDERFNPPSTTASVIGPIFALRLPVGASDKVLTFKFTEGGRNAHLSNDLLKQIAASVKLAP